MIKNIQYRGYTTSPEDYSCPDGDLAALSGITPEEEGLRAQQGDEDLFDLPKSLDLAYQHDTPDWHRYILVDRASGRLSWREPDGRTSTIQPTPELRPHSILSMGKTLIALCPDGIHYLLGTHDGYRYLGQGIPSIRLELSDYSKYIMGLPVASGEFKHQEPNYYHGLIARELNYESAEHDAERGKGSDPYLIDRVVYAPFTFPYLVRYALRLYDGSLVSVSSPILMNMPRQMPSMAFAETPQFGWRLFLRRSGLQWSFDGSRSIRDNLALWSDVVKSVDIFISSPIYTYDPNAKGELRETTPRLGDIARFVPELEIDPDLVSVMSSYNKTRIFVAPHKDRASIKKEIADASTFYLYCSIPLDRLTNDEAAQTHLAHFSEKRISLLSTQEQLSDSVRPDEALSAAGGFVYNARLNLWGIKRTIMPRAAAFPVLSFSSTLGRYTDGDVYFSIEREGRRSYYHAGKSKIPLSPSGDPYLPYLYCPSALCREAYIIIGSKHYLLPMKAHDFLSGAYFCSLGVMGALGDLLETYRVDASKQLDDRQLKDTPSLRSENQPGLVYTSRVNNPFAFPSSSVNVVGAGSILGLSAATRALSSGQFGQFPLYAFTSEGIWALEVSSEGTYRTKQPISRDVCVSPESITQIDSAVVFASSRGLMLLSGSQLVSLSDNIDDRRSASSKLDRTLASKIPQLGSLSTPDDDKPFRDFLRSARVAYDYPKGRIIVFDPNSNQPSYVYSLRNKQWSRGRGDLERAIPSYPNSLAMTKSGKVVDLAKETLIKGVKGTIVTRPLKLDLPDQLKTIDRIIQRGSFTLGKVQSILHGSNDLSNWQLVASSSTHILSGFSGSSYKYFRITLICDLDPSDYLWGCSVSYTPRYTDKLR